MKNKLLIGIVFLLLANNFIFARIPQEYPGLDPKDPDSKYCDFTSKTRQDIEQWLGDAYDHAVNAIKNGRNNHKLSDCKIKEIQAILPDLIFEYSCACPKGGNKDACGGQKHKITKTPYILICDPFNLFHTQQKDLDNPPRNSGCIEGMIVHEIIHATGGDPEEGPVDCSKILYPCAHDPWGVATPDHGNCKCCDKKI